MAPQSLVQYVYVLDNPLKYADPFGLAVVDIITVGGVDYVDFFATLRTLGLTDKGLPKNIGTGSYVLISDSGYIHGSNDSYLSYEISIFFYIPPTTEQHFAVSSTVWEQVQAPDGPHHRPVETYEGIYQGGKVLFDVEYFQKLMCEIGEGKAFET
jgi:hypothetical protein